VPLSKRSSPIFSGKISFYPMPAATFLEISGAKFEQLEQAGFFFASLSHRLFIVIRMVVFHLIGAEHDPAPV